MTHFSKRALFGRRAHCRFLFIAFLSLFALDLSTGAWVLADSAGR